MNKRKLLKFGGVSLLALTFSGFKLPSLGGGGGDSADWGTIAGDINKAFARVAGALKLVLKGIVESNKAIGIKETAATQLITDLERAEGGSKVDVAIFEKANTTIKDQSAAIAQKIESSALTAEEKKALAAASVNYFKGGLNAFVGYIQTFAAFKKAQSAGQPGPADLMKAGVKDLPDIISNAPAMFKMVPTTYDAVMAYRKSLEAADIKLPEEAKGLEKQKKGLSF
jgi:hypothetical protein